MDLMRTWILSVTAVAMLIAVAEGLMPEGTVRKVAKITGGLVLMLAVLQPLVRMDYDTLFQAANGDAQVEVFGAQAQQQASGEFLKTIIEDEVRAYVLDKAEQLGYHCEVSITCQLGEDGVPVPATATVQGLSDPEQQRVLRMLLREELGIAYEQQTYLGEETP